MEDLIKLLIYIALIAIVGFFAVFIRSGASSELGCQTVMSMNGWQSCELVNHKIVAVGLRGCSDNDGHAYEVKGTNVSGQLSEALVCCGTVLKSCTVRGR